MTLQEIVRDSMRQLNYILASRSHVANCLLLSFFDGLQRAHCPLQRARCPFQHFQCPSQIFLCPNQFCL